MVRRFGRLTADLPFRGDADVGVPGRVFRPQWRELDPYVRVDGLSWRDGRLVIEGCAYIPSVDIGARRRASKFVVLVPAGRRKPPLVVRARTIRNSGETARSGQDRYSYEWSGFR